MEKEMKHIKEVQITEDMQNSEEPKKKKENKKAPEKTKQKNYVIRQWLKVPALILCVLSVFGMMASGVAMLFLYEDNLRGNEIQTELDKAFLNAYGSILLQDTGIVENENVRDGLDGLDGGNIRYTVTSTSEGGKETVLYSNASDVNSKTCLQEVSTADSSNNYQRQYNTQTFGSMLSGIRLAGDPDMYLNHYGADISEFIYTKDTGLFYCHAADDYFLLPWITMRGSDENLGEYTYELKEKGGVYSYYCEDETAEQPVADAETIGKWMDESRLIWVNSSISFPDDVVIADSSEIPKNDVLVYGKDYSGHEIVIYDSSIPEGMFYCETEPKQEGNVYAVYLSLEKDIKSGKTLNNGISDYFSQLRTFSAWISGILRNCGILMVFSFVLFVIGFLYLMVEAGKRDKENRLVLRVWDKIPFGIFAFGMFYLLCIVAYLVDGINDVVKLAFVSPVIVVAFMSLIICLGIGFMVSIAARIKAKKFWHYTVLNILLQPLRIIGRGVRSNVPLFVKGILILTGITIAEIVVLSSEEFDIIFVCFYLYKIAECLVVGLLLYQINQIDKGGMRTAAGNYSEPVPTRHMFWEFKRIAENINHVSDGISLAVEEKMKSERFKTELITNVSHDIKTPLTSIINYVDLIKKEEITSDTMQEYVEVLDRQSLRLKKLIEDLMEASKASTGNLPVHMELCDAAVMLTQVIGEFKERAEQNQLELVVESPKPPVSIMADGRHLWRVIDNLMSNICKYAMPGTRVYITLEQFHGMVIMTFRNISKSKLNISSEELMERFVRGDSSRNTEGSGLGLSIAQSLTGLMDGNMALQIDGDLFKAIVSFEEVVKK